MASRPKHVRGILIGVFFAIVVLPLTVDVVIPEPMLEPRFGERYREYRRHVRGFIPRMRAWSAT